MLRVGLISDTHGLLRPEAEAFLKGSDFIIHAGDIGEPDILQRLGVIAPVTAVRGNNDHGSWAEALGETEFLQVGDLWLYVLHDLAELDIDPRGAGVRIVVAGHSHKPLIEERDGVMYVNPGSAGPRRFRLPIAVGELLIQGQQASARTVALDQPPTPGPEGSATRKLRGSPDVL
ncbi:MAG: metallophosphoesterase family protein [Burkholderiales bacterium]|nr:metallophosphoesterase family protein [Burkholderiales bacterium]